MLFWKQPLILPFLYYKSVTTGQIDSKQVSKKAKMMEDTAPPR